MTKEALEASLSNLETLIQIFAVICAVGLAGEVAFGVRSWLLSKKLHEILEIESQSREAEVARLKKEAEEVKIQAAQAIEHSANAESKVAEANRGWEEAKAGTATALTDFEKQKERTALAEKELILLKQKMAPCRISTEERMRLLPLLKASQKGNVILAAPMGDAEAEYYAQDIVSVLIEAGWNSKNEIGISTFRGMGVYLIVKNTKSPPLGAVQLQSAFTKIGIQMHAQDLESMPGDSIQIFVGSKQ
jgi:hypothetical protein